jgi:hypothetical protein
MRKSKENHDGSKERHFPGRMFPKIGNPFPTAWEIPLSIVVADIVFVNRSNGSRLALVGQHQLIVKDPEQCIQKSKGAIAYARQ